MGVRGAALATVMSQGVSAVLCATYIMKKTPILVPKREHFRFDAELWKELFGQGISMALMGSIVSIGTVILQYGINGFGSMVIVAHMASSRTVFGSAWNAYADKKCPSGNRRKVTSDPVQRN